MKRRGILTLATACVALIGGAVSAPTSATAQIPDIIVIDGKTEDLLSEPLGRAFAGHPMLREYFERHSRGGVCSALWRGYRATWEIREDALYLVKIKLDACSAKPREIELFTVFPGTTGPVLAAWYSGTLTVSQGAVLEYVHLGYASRYERYRYFEVSKGKVIRSRYGERALGFDPDTSRPTNQEKLP